MKTKNYDSTKQTGFYSTLLLASLSAAISLLVTACGASPSKKTQAGTSDATGGTGEYACNSADACKDILALASVDASTKGTAGDLIGVVNTNVAWRFSGVDGSGGDRKVGIFVTGGPSGAKLTREAGAVDAAGQSESAMVVDWTSSSALKSNSDSEKFKVIIRDLNRCRVAEADPNVCDQPNSLAAYDKPELVGWEVLTAEAYQALNGGLGTDTSAAATIVSNPDCGVGATTSTGEILMRGAQIGIGVLTGGIGALIPAAIQGIGQGMQGGQQATQC